MMTINLLPNEDHKISATTILLGFVEFLLMAVAVCLIIGAIWLQTAVSGVSTQVAQKKAEKDKYKSSLEKATELQQKLQNIIDRQAAWKTAEADNGHYGELLAEIALATPDTVQLTSLSNKTEALTITGIAVNRADITTLVDNLNKNAKLSAVTLGQANAQATGVTFSLTAKLKSASSASPSPSTSPTSTP